jgi:hypothetical protein
MAMIIWYIDFYSWIYNYPCNQCLSPLMLWIPISIRARCTTLCDKFCQWLETGRWCSPVSSTNKTDHHDITEILKNTIKQANKQNQVLVRSKLEYCSTLGDPHTVPGPKFFFGPVKNWSHWSKWHNGGPNILWHLFYEKKTSDINI